LQTGSEVVPFDGADDFFSAVDTASQLTDDELSDEGPDGAGFLKEYIDAILPHLEQVTHRSNSSNDVFKDLVFKVTVLCPRGSDQFVEDTSRIALDRI